MRPSLIVFAAALQVAAVAVAGCGARSPLESADASSGADAPPRGPAGRPGASCVRSGFVELASSPGAGAVAADESGVYWAVEDGIWRRTLDGEEPTELVSGEPMPFAVALDRDYVYWTASVPGGSTSQLSRVPKAGGPIEHLWKGSFELALGLAVDASHVYWIGEYGWSTDDDRSEILAIPKAGGAARSLVANQSGPASIAVDEARVYWLNAGMMKQFGAGKVRAIPKTGGDVVTLASNQGSYVDEQETPNKIATDGATLAWVLREGTVRAVSTEGGAVSTIAFGQDVPRALTVDDGDVYWTNAPDDGSPGSLMRASTLGEKPEVLLDGLEQPWSVVTHGAFVYWTDFMQAGQVGAVFRACK